MPRCSALQGVLCVPRGDFFKQSCANEFVQYGDHEGGGVAFDGDGRGLRGTTDGTPAFSDLLP